MKQLIFIIAIIISAASISFSQNVDYNTVILPSGIEDLDIREKLVQLAWSNYPANEEAQRVVEIAQHNVKVAGLDWLNMIQMNLNFNEFNIDASNERNQFYPRYNLGIRIPLGSFIEIPKNIKIAKEDLEISKLRVNETKLRLRANVLRRYQNYVTYKEVYKIQKEAETDSYSNHLLIEQKFKAAEVHVSAFVQSSKNFNDQRVKTVVSENAYKQSVIALEELIGVKLIDVN